MSRLNFAADIASAAPLSDFLYGAQDAAGLLLSLSIFADRGALRQMLREDAEDAGFRIAEVAGLATLLGEAVRPLGEVVLVDCPEVDGRVLAALARLDTRAAHCGALLVVSTSVEALDDVFGCLDQSAPQILVDPSRAERVIALGQALARQPGRRVREISSEDRQLLLRLMEQVTRIAQRIDPASAPALTEDLPAFAFTPPEGEAQLPDPRLVRRIIRHRQARKRHFAGELFADPAWDMLLDLTAAQGEGVQVSVTSLCIASGVPPTTALRWIGQMTETGWFQRREDERDGRRAFIALSPRAVAAMSAYFSALGAEAGCLV